MGNTKTRDPIPEFETLNDIAEFWDAHSTAQALAHTRGVSVEALINV